VINQFRCQFIQKLLKHFPTANIARKLLGYVKQGIPFSNANQKKKEKVS